MVPDVVQNIADEVYYLRQETTDFAMFKMNLLANDCPGSTPAATLGFDPTPTIESVCD